MAEEPNVKKQKLDESDETESEGKNSQNKETRHQTRQVLYRLVQTYLNSNYVIQEQACAKV